MLPKHSPPRLGLGGLDRMLLVDELSYHIQRGDASPPQTCVTNARGGAARDECVHPEGDDESDDEEASFVQGIKVNDADANTPAYGIISLTTVDVRRSGPASFALDAATPDEPCASGGGVHFGACTKIAAHACAHCI